MTFEVIDLKTKKSHGKYETLAEAKGCVLYDRLTEWEIWQEGIMNCNSVVAYKDSGRY